VIEQKRVSTVESPITMKQTLCSLVAATTLVILPSLVSAKTDAAAGSSGLDLARRLESAFVQVAEEAARPWS